MERPNHTRGRCRHPVLAYPQTPPPPPLAFCRVTGTPRARWRAVCIERQSRSARLGTATTVTAHRLAKPPPFFCSPLL